MADHQSPRHLPIILAAGVVAVSLSAIFIRLADAPGVVVALHRMVIASLVIAPWTIRALAATPLTKRNSGYAVLAGILLGAHFATWISSLSYTTVAASVTLVTTIPLWMALMSWLFLRIAPSFAVIVGVMIAVLGGALIGFGGEGEAAGTAPLVGNGLALAGAVFASGYLLLGRAAQRRGLSLQAYIGVAYAVAALTLAPLPLIFGFTYLGYAPEAFIWIALLALVPQLIGHTSYNYAMRHLDPTLVATLTLLEPVGATLLALALFAEVPPVLTIFGAAIVLLGVALTIKHSRVPSSP